jgi:hypothetical protein
MKGVIVHYITHTVKSDLATFEQWTAFPSLISMPRLAGQSRPPVRRKWLGPTHPFRRLPRIPAEHTYRYPDAGETNDMRNGQLLAIDECDDEL